MKETIEQSAATIWGIARDLASPHYIGASLNCERNIKYIASVISAFAAKHAEDQIVTAEASKAALAQEHLRNAQNEIKHLHQLAKAKEKDCT